MKRLSAWNPLDHLRLLWWLLMEPQQLKVHREQYGEKAERSTGKWLVSTLIWLPFFLPFSAVGLKITPFSPYTLTPLNTEITLTATPYLWGSGGLFIAWLLTGLFGDRDEDGVKALVVLMVGLALGLAGGLAVGLAGGLAGGLAVVHGVGLAVGLAAGILAELGQQEALAVGLMIGITGVIIVEVQAFIAVFMVVRLADKLEEALKTGRASWKTKGAFGLLVAVYAFLLWYSYLGGWRVF